VRKIIMIKHFDGKDFNEDIKEGITLVDFFATWCGPCKMLMPEVETLATEKTDINYLLIDIDKFRDLAIKSNIRSVPTLVLFKDGVEISKRSGFAPKEDLLKWILEHQK